MSMLEWFGFANQWMFGIFQDQFLNLFSLIFDCFVCFDRFGFSLILFAERLNL